MTTIFSKTFPKTIDCVVQKYSQYFNADNTINLWLFDDEVSRRKKEEELAEKGIQARLRSSYKPLLHFFLEELDFSNSDISAIQVMYPVCSNAPANRFLLETYPLAALLKDIEITFQPGRQDQFFYDLLICNNKGEKSKFEIFAPNRTHPDPIGEPRLSSTGWITVHDSKGFLLINEQIETDLEILFSETMAAIADHQWRKEEPFFEELNISVSLPGRERPLDYGQENISIQEALHEEFYFSLLEYFQKIAIRPTGDRTLQVGQIVPEIHYGDGQAQVVVETRNLLPREITGKNQDLDTASSPITSTQVQAELSLIGGTQITAPTRAGRLVRACYHVGNDRPVIISGGQHANETTGVVGSLRAAKKLAERPSSHFIISPLENPDGYALHQRLIQQNPHHIHHAARYTSFGDDLGHRPKGDTYEKEIRHKALRLSCAQLHINLHGYPSHEWTRPLSGYIPQGFDMWTIPKGFFLIVNHHDSWSDWAESLIYQVTEKLGEIPGLLDFTQSQMDLYRVQTGDIGFEIIKGFPCLISKDDQQDVPITLITEYPDETSHGGSFIDGHTAQMATVLAAYEAYQGL